MALVAAGLVWVVCRIVLRRSNAWLLHANVLNADCLDVLLFWLETRGYRFVSLEEAMNDPAAFGVIAQKAKDSLLKQAA